MHERFDVATNHGALSSPRTRAVLAALVGSAAFCSGGCGSGAFSSAPPDDAASAPKTPPDSAVPSQGVPNPGAQPDAMPTLATGATPATIGEDGKLGGGLYGYAWVAGGTGTTWISPAACSDQSCFQNTGGALCVQGSIAALTCSSPAACDWDTNWGAMIGWNTTSGNAAWGAAAAAHIAVTYAGGSGEYRLMVHVAGDPDSKSYCIERYVSGTMATASDFLSQCWSQSGDVLSAFSDVDKMGLQVISAQHPVDFDVCISAITLL